MEDKTLYVIPLSLIKYICTGNEKRISPGVLIQLINLAEITDHEMFVSASCVINPTLTVGSPGCPLSQYLAYLFFYNAWCKMTMIQWPVVGVYLVNNIV